MKTKTPLPCVFPPLNCPFSVPAQPVNDGHGHTVDAHHSPCSKHGLSSITMALITSDCDLTAQPVDDGHGHTVEEDERFPVGPVNPMAQVRVPPPLPACLS